MVGVVSRTRPRRTTREREPELFPCRRLCVRRTLHGVGVTITPISPAGGTHSRAHVRFVNRVRIFPRTNGLCIVFREEEEQEVNKVHQLPFVLVAPLT